MQGKFLHATCRTEQNVKDIEHRGLKVCLCPGCKQECCADYCVFFYSGKWNEIDPDAFIPDENASPQEHEKRYRDFEKASQKQLDRYNQTRKEYGITS